MNLSSSCLLLGGVASFLILLLHLALALRPQRYRHFGADELAQMHEQGSRFTVLTTLGLALLFAVWGIYGLSGAGVIGQLCCELCSSPSA
jgi:putative oxidoreductase